MPVLSGEHSHILRPASERIKQALARIGATPLCDCLGTDVHCVNPPYIGPLPKTFDDGSTIDEWGVRRRQMPNEYAERRGKSIR
ncbi:MAG: hypothetical protein ACC628_20385 [Pirellulaceae bacterium]